MTKPNPSGGVPEDAPIVLLGPGMALMHVQRISPTVVFIGCPGCGAGDFVCPTSIAAAGLPEFVFVHEDNDCPVKVQIESGLNQLKKAGLNFSLLWES
jgi:hypothetical protein